MVRLVTYERQQGLQPTATPAAGLSNAVAQELTNFGGAVMSVGDAIVQREKQKQDFTAQNNYHKFGMELQDELQQRAESITPGGDGFHDSFMSDVYTQKRDAFLASLPPRLRPQYEELTKDHTGSDYTDWSIKAATTQRDESYRWYKGEITDASNSLAAGIGADPENYDNYYDRGRTLIQSSGLPTADKDVLLHNWDQMAMTASLNSQLATDPQGVTRNLGADARQLSPTTQFAMLSNAVQWQESRDNPNVVSGKGAVGLMQVMPGTAPDIAKALGDTDFPYGAPDDVVRAYLSNPVVNKRYGDLYLKQQLRDFAGARNPIEAALVAYNAGPSVAKRWIESGYDDSVLSKETRDYKKTIMTNFEAPYVKGDPSKVVFTMNNGREMGPVVPELKDRVATAFAMVGLSKVSVNSGFRDPKTNARVGGAEHSEHLKGDALDINVAGMKIPQRIELIKALSASGITGIGIYANTIHADLGGRRAWGPSHGFESVPKWASGVIAEHLQGTTPPPRKTDARYSGLDYDTRQQFITKADQAISQQQAAAAKVSSVDKVQVRTAADNNLATIAKTGQSIPGFDETSIATVLGEDDYLTYANKKATATATYTAVQGINQMSDADMEQHYKEYDPVAGADNFASQQQVQAAVRKEIDRVQGLRARSPDQAALEYPEVKGAYAAIQAKVAQGQDPDAQETQTFVKMMLDKQAEFNIKPEARAPVPHDWAMAIGQALTNVPVMKGGTKLADARASIIQYYDQLHEVFGDYTDEVMTYALSEYKGLDKPTADLIAGYMSAISAGHDPFTRYRAGAVDSGVDQSQVNQFNAVGLPIIGTLFAPFVQPAPTEDGTGPQDPEAVIRAREAAASDAP